MTSDKWHCLGANCDHPTVDLHGWHLRIIWEYEYDNALFQSKWIVKLISSMTVYHRIEQNLSKINKLSGNAHTHQNYLQHYISLCLKLFLAKIWGTAEGAYILNEYENCQYFI